MAYLNPPPIRRMIVSTPRKGTTMGKRKEERQRILAIIERHALECEAGRQTLSFDAEDKTTKAELARQAKRLRWLAKEICKGHKEAETPNG